MTTFYSDKACGGRGRGRWGVEGWGCKCDIYLGPSRLPMARLAWSQTRRHLGCVGGLGGWCRGVGIGWDSGKRGGVGQEKHAQAFVCIRRFGFWPGRHSVCLPFYGAAMPTATGRGVGTGQERPRPQPGNAAHARSARRFIVRRGSAFIPRYWPTVAAPRVSSSANEQLRGSWKFPMMTGTVNEHRPARDQGEEGGGWGWGGVGGRRRAIIVTHAAKIKATTQRGLTLSFTMRHFSGSRRQTVDTELVSQGSHIFCRKQYLAGCSAPPGSTVNRSGGRGRSGGD